VILNEMNEINRISKIKSKNITTLFTSEKWWSFLRNNFRNGLTISSSKQIMASKPVATNIYGEVILSKPVEINEIIKRTFQIAKIKAIGSNRNGNDSILIVFLLGFGALGSSSVVSGSALG
jgi:hypothetical protein